MDNKLRIGVIFGGPSSEKEVSLESGRHMVQSLDRERFEVVPLYLCVRRQIWKIPPKLLVMNATKDITDQLEQQAMRIRYEELSEIIDFMLIGLHGKYGEDGCFQGLLELLGIPYSGSGVLSSAVGMNKHVARRVASAAGIVVPEYRVIRTYDWNRSPQTSLDSVAAVSFPLVVKPVGEGCSTAVAKVHTREELQQAINAALQWDPECLVDEFIDGMEITTTVIGNDSPQSWSITETPPAFGHTVLTLEDKFLPGGAEMITPARLSNEETARIQEENVIIFRALRLKGYARIDGFVRNGTFIFNEVNTLPGATPSTCLIQQAAIAGLSPTDLFTKIIALGLEAHQNKKGPLT